MNGGNKMSLQIVAGGSGAGKSTYIYSDVIEKSMKYPEKKLYCRSS